MRTFESDRTDVVTVGASPLSRVRWSSVLAGTVAFLSLRGEIGKPLRPRPREGSA